MPLLNFACPNVLLGSAPVTSPGDNSTFAVWLALFATGLAVFAAIIGGVLRSDRLGTKPRIPPGRPMMPLVGALFTGLVVWLVTPSLYVRADQERSGGGTPVASQPTSGPSIYQPSTRELVIVNAAVPALAFVVLLMGDFLVHPRVEQNLGIALRKIPHGLVMGVAAIVLSFPIVYAVMMVTDWFFRRRGFHPPEHDLLRAMDQTPDKTVKDLAIIAAAVVAPLWEELLFRGHVQTLIREVLIRRYIQKLFSETFFRSRHALTTTVAPALPPRGGPVLEYEGRDVVRDKAQIRTPGAHPVESWFAIVLVSILFASVHQPWTFPAIFCLSLCLGFAYERTGNLWVPIFMHATFNATMTAYFLMHGR